jgi:hypothetical protein
MVHKAEHPGRGGARRGVRNATSKARNSLSSFNTRRVDLEAINRAAHPLLPVLVARWLPNGKRIGREYLALNPRRADRHLGSFKIVTSDHRVGRPDFATGDKGGDRRGDPNGRLAEVFVKVGTEIDTQAGGRTDQGLTVLSAGWLGGNLASSPGSRRRRQRVQPTRQAPRHPLFEKTS